MAARRACNAFGVGALTSLARALVLIAAAVALAACGSDSDDAPKSPPPTTTAERTTTTAEPDGGGSDGEGTRLPVGDGRGGVDLQQVGEFEQPLYVTQPEGERDLFVVEQGGRILRVPTDGGAPEMYLDLSDQISCCGEQGLLSVAFAPDYERSGLLYVDYTDVDGDTRVVEYRRDASGATADPDSARELLRVDQPYSNHNGGLLMFGPDGLLYLGLGDGGSADDPQRNGQDLSTALGKLLRIDLRPTGGEPYGIPPGNPFADQAGARPEIYSYGLRNPWRFSFDRETGALWIGDVGQNAFEEVDGVARGEGAGANFGWSAFEGEVRFNEDQEAPGHVPPVLTYGRDRGCSVTGGYVVRDRALPTLYGRYLYGDYCEGQLRSFTARPDREATDDRPLGPTVPALSSFGEDASGRVYITSLEGPVYRLVPAG
jgi:glucose/arabinose dehydrogenase